MPRPKGTALTQKDIIDAAVALLHQDNGTPIGINSVARQLGIAPPSMYNHVAGNDALYRLIALEGWQRFLITVQAYLVDVVDAKGMLRAAAYSFRDCARANAGLLSIAMNHRLSLDDPEFVDIYKQIVQIYEQALRPLGYSHDEVVHAARMLNATFLGFAQAEKAQMFVMPQTLDESYDWMVTKLIETLTRSSPASSLGDSIERI